MRREGRPNIYAPDFNRDGAFSVQCGSRAVWFLAHGKPIPDGWRTYVVCGEPSCCNPQHIRCTSRKVYNRWLRDSGLHKNNVRHLVANRASSRSRAALTPAQAEYVLTSPKTGVALALEFGVSTTTISKYRRGKCISVPSTGVFSGLMRAVA